MTFHDRPRPSTDLPPTACIRRGALADAGADGSGGGGSGGGGGAAGGGDDDEAGVELSESRGLVPGDQSLPTQRHVYFQM